MLTISIGLTWIKKQDPIICCLQKNTPHFQRQTQALSQRIEKDIASKWSLKTSRNTFISDKTDFKLN
jgi:hypothetical protein